MSPFSHISVTKEMLSFPFLCPHKNLSCITTMCTRFAAVSLCMGEDHKSSKQCPNGNDKKALRLAHHNVSFWP